MHEEFFVTRSFYVWLLSKPYFLIILAVAVPSLLIALIFARVALRRPPADRSADNTATAAIRLVGGAFIFFSAFSTMSAWQGVNHLLADVTREFHILGTIADDIERVKPMSRARLAPHMVEYAQIVRTEELGPDGFPTRSRNAAKKLAEIEQMIDTVLSGTLPDDHTRVAKLVDHLEDFKDTRKDRLSRPSPMVPPVVLMLLVIVGMLTLMIVGLYPAPPDRLMKWVQVISSALVVAGLMATVLLLESPSLPYRQLGIERPIALFLDSMDNIQD